MKLLTMYTHRVYFIEKAKEILKPLVTIWYFLKMLNNGKLLELLKICNTIERVESNKDGDLYIGFKNNVILNINGSTVIVNKEEFIMSYKFGAFSPDFNVEELVNIKDINGSVIKLVQKRRTVENIKMKEYLKQLERELVENIEPHKPCGCKEN